MAAATVSAGRERLLPYEPALDGLRGVSIAAVLTYHACAASGRPEWARGGFIGVSVFFTLSGFLITSLLLAERERRGAIDLRRFWARRIRRLAPAALIVVSGVVALSASGVLSARASDAAAAIWSFTNWHVVLGGEDRLLQTIVGPLGPTWSLAVEEQLYLALVLAVVLTGRAHRARRALAAVALATVAASFGLANTISDWQPRLEFGTDIKAAEVAVGVLLALVWHGRTVPAWWSRAADPVAAGGLLVLVLCFLAVDLDPPWLLRGGYTLIALVSAATIAGLLAGERAGALLSRPAMVGLGAISYSLYLVHWPAISVLSADRLGFDGIPLAAIQIAVSVVLAVAVHVAVEQPARRLATPFGPTLVAYLAASAGLTVVAVVTLA